jgi:hypothetical protein
MAPETGLPWSSATRPETGPLGMAGAAAASEAAPIRLIIPLKSYRPMVVLSEALHVKINSISKSIPNENHFYLKEFQPPVRRADS